MMILQMIPDLKQFITVQMNQHPAFFTFAVKVRRAVLTPGKRIACAFTRTKNKFADTSIFNKSFQLTVNGCRSDRFTLS